MHQLLIVGDVFLVPYFVRFALMPPNRRKQTQVQLEATRRAIQHEYLRLLSAADFSFEEGTKEPRGIQARVVENVNKMRNRNETLETHHVQVQRWVKRVRKNKWQVTDTKTNYSTTSQNS